MLSLENICINKVLNVCFMKRSDIDLLELRGMNCKDRIRYFEETIICQPVVTLHYN